MPTPHLSAPALSRREFLSTAALLPLGVAASASLMGPALRAADAVGAPTTGFPPAKLKLPIGLELYSVRGELARDLPGTLRAVAGLGYEVVEFYAPYFSWTMPYAKDVRSLLDDLGMRCLSTHNGFASFTPGETMARAIELNQILGTRYVIMASPPPNTTGLDGWKRVCANLSEAVTQLHTHGLSAGYHNHQTEWARVDGDQRVMDVIAANTPKEFALQFDVGTCMEAGADPIAWIKANPGRIKSVHLKDWTPGTASEGKGYRVLFGEGVSPWKEILATCESVGGVEFYLLEQEGSRFPEIETAKRCLASWRQMQVSRKA